MQQWTMTPQQFVVHTPPEQTNILNVFGSARQILQIVQATSQLLALRVACGKPVFIVLTDLSSLLFVRDLLLLNDVDLYAEGGEDTKRDTREEETEEKKDKILFW